MSTYFRQLMQERLDGQLDDEKAEELLGHLAADAEAAEENAQLEQVHQLLDKAPAVRAPERLAATIMARIAQTVREEAKRNELQDEVQLALMLSISTVSISMMPLMVASSYMVMNTWRSPKLLTQTAYRVIAMQAMMIDGIVILMEEAQTLIQEDPELAPVAMSLIPVTLKGMLDALHGDMTDVMAQVNDAETDTET